MKKIHITLIGGQLIPTFKGILAAGPDLTYLIYTKQSKEDAKWVAKNLDHEYNFVEVDTTDTKLIRAVYDELLPESGIISVNITAATKPMAITLFQKYQFLENAEIFYLDQNDVYVDIKNQKTKRITIPIDIQTWVTLQKSQLLSFKTLKEYDNNHVAVIDIFRKHENQFGFEISGLLGILRRSTDPRVLHHKKVNFQSSSVFYDHELQSFVFEVINGTGKAVFKISCKEVFKYVVHTQWFEVETAMMLAPWLKITEMYLALVFPYENKLPKNEIDIAINLGNRILVIECKTSLSDIKDLDKFQNAVKFYFGTSATPFLITDKPIKKSHAEKCRDIKINHICIAEIKKSGKDISGELIRILEQNLSQNNRE